MFERLLEKNYQIAFEAHAKAILLHDFPEAIGELESVIEPFAISIAEIVAGGGGLTAMTQRLRQGFAERGWDKRTFTIEKRINDRFSSSVSHEVDHVRGFGDTAIALEIEWNNKDPFFDRDLENFKRLHVEGAISLGVIVTRGTTFQSQIRERVSRFAHARGVRSIDDLALLGLAPTARQKRLYEQSISATTPFSETFANLFCSDKFAESTTHWRKLEDRIRRRVGHPCPLLLIGIPIEVVTEEV